MNTTQLKCFVTVAETLNFARAAELLHTTQPTVTHQIRSLEDELHTKLFRRTTRKVEVTDAGLIFYHDAKAMLNISNTAVKRFAEPARPEHSILTIGCHTYNELYRLSGALSRMRADHPNFYPVFQVAPFRYLFQLLDEGSIDVVMSFQEEWSTAKKRIYRELGKIPMVGIMPVQHPLAQSHTLAEKDIQSERLILIDPQKEPEYVARVQSQLAKDKPLSELCFCDSFDAAITLALAGYGIAILPLLFSLDHLSLTCVPLENFQPLSYGLYYQSKDIPLLRPFLQRCSECF